MQPKELKDLKVGDEVAVYVRGSFHSIQKIEKITPKGFFRVSSYLYSKDGHLKTSDPWRSGHIKPVSQKHLDSIEKNNIQSYLYKNGFGKASLEQLRAIYNILVNGVDSAT